MSTPGGDDHGALMDRIYRPQRHIYDLTRKYYLFGRDRLIRQLALKPGARLVEVGCGTARNLVKIAARYPAARLYGLDASSVMLETARHTLAEAGLAGRVKLAHGYAEVLSPAMFDESGPFDACLFSYSLSMIPDWRGALSAAAGSLADGGSLHVVDFGDLKGLGRVGQSLMLKWLSLFHVAPRVELLSSLEQTCPRNVEVLWGRYAFLLSINNSSDTAFHSLLQLGHRLG